MSAAFFQRLLPIVIVFAIVITCAADLAEVWRVAPYDKAGGWAFLVWLFPLVYAARVPAEDYTLLSLSVVIAAVSRFMDIHVVAHIALALAVVSIGPKGFFRWVWFATALAWMPLMGYVGSKGGFPPITIHLFRIIGVLIGVSWLFWYMQYRLTIDKARSHLLINKP